MLRKIFLMMFALVLCAGAVFAQTDSTPTKSETATSSDAPKTTARFTPTKAQIQAGQEFLKAKKLYSGEASGKYNAETKAAIRVFQKDNGLKVTENFNQATLEKMNIPLTDKQKARASTSPSSTAAGAVDASATKSPRVAATAASSDSTAKASPTARTSPSTTEGPKKPAPFQATKDQIMALQKILKDGKMFAGEANGERSEALKDAVKKYQEANGLKATGGINAVTLEKMGIALTDAQKANVAAQAAYDAGKKN